MSTTPRARSLTLGFLTLCGAVGCAGAPAPASPTGVAATPATAPAYALADLAQAATAPAPPPPPVSMVSGRSEPPEPVASKLDRKVEAAPDRDAARDRPGLGTQWGETRQSPMTYVSFERADGSSPFATAALFYDDEEGARAMAAASGFHRTAGGPSPIANGLVSIGLRDDAQRFFKGFSAGGRNYAVGEAGRAYTIVARNNTSFRIEVVLSVDGLDVRDGQPSAFAKRGYILEPRAELDIDGFRQSKEEVAAFRFGSVRGSYTALKTGNTSNVGVIGIALFNEAGTHPSLWTPDEIQRRRDANPFPGELATPP